ncbi:T9SS type A sorting domain-containing protein [Flavobacteriaceae bacterium]|nr:T9SS type A sorting domain-containing protein [Flavobacteriaceae bacterium]
MKNLFFLFLMISIKLSSQVNYNVPSHEWKNSTQPWLDLYLINSSTTSVSINAESRVETSNTGVAYADFNENGYLDILTLAQAPDGEFPLHQMLINNGDGTYSPDNTLLTNPGFEAHGPRKTVVGDFNGDNKPDVVRIGGGHDILENTNILMSGTDNYTFTEIDVIPETQYHGFASGDLDNDGDLDLFFGQPESGFAMNDGSGNFTWYSVDEKISNYFAENTEQDGPYGVGTVEILDINQDGNLDIVVGGAYADADYDYMLMGPTILWGDGSSNYDYDNKTEIWGFGEKPTMPDGSNVDNNDDISFGDIDNDGYLDVVLTYIRQIDNDPNNNGNPSYKSVLQIFNGGENNEFTDVTNEWTSNPLILLDFPVTWVLVRDVDNNGMIDIVESEKVLSGAGGWRNSIRWEWNGSSLITAEIDTDVDGVLDYVDNCPDTPNSDQSDINNNGIGDVCDSSNGTSECGDTVVYTQVANGDYSTSLYSGDDLLASVTINATMEVNYDFIIVTDGAGNQLNTQDDGDFVDADFYSTDGTITVQVLNDSGVENGDVTLAFACVSLSTPENERLDMIIYPNPTDNILFIKGNKNLMSVSVYNMLGKEVLSKMNTNNIDVKILPKGVYIIKISDDVSQTYRKFIKN